MTRLLTDAEIDQITARAERSRRLALDCNAPHYIAIPRLCADLKALRQAVREHVGECTCRHCDALRALVRESEPTEGG